MLWRIEKNYRNDNKLRHSFNELAKETFGLDFEDWYQNGFWGDNYNPYSVVVDGKVVANVSVNRTDMLLTLDGKSERSSDTKTDGNVRHFLQLGTVMTDKVYRKQGFIRKIMEEIEKDYSGKADGIYLFANDSVLDFYPKFGFESSAEYQYSRKVQNAEGCRLEAVLMDNTAAWKKLQAVMERNVFRGKFDMINNDNLVMFYVTKFMQENVFYHKETDTYVIAEIKNGTLLLHNVFSGTVRDLDAVIGMFGKNIREVTLGFVPLETEKYEAEESHEKDCTFFVKGAEMKIVEKEKLRVPLLARA